VYEGWTVPLDYDPMMSKLIAFAPDRPAALARMRRALDEYFVGGIKTNLSLFRRILEHPDFQEARIDTGFLDRLLASEAGHPNDNDSLAKVAAISAAIFSAISSSKVNGDNGKNGKAAARGSASSAWKRAARFEGIGNE
ncbi:MAG TPA: hypothetical protein VN679_08135, partial [Candidatus Acidoferrales bacterium]|nr:hypothetical protein [Candidatus Acidoferrales bacterium]